MFLRRYQRTKQGKTHTYYALVESVRTDAGPRQRVVAHLGELNHDQEQRWQRTVIFYNRQGSARQRSVVYDDKLQFKLQEVFNHGLVFRIDFNKIRENTQRRPIQ